MTLAQIPARPCKASSVGTMPAETRQTLSISRKIIKLSAPATHDLPGFT